MSSVTPPRIQTNLDQRAVLDEALAIYDQRNRHYHDNWRRFGWKGCLFRLRERTERAWDRWWYASDGIEGVPDVDDLLDLINFAAFTVRAIRERNRDGEWFQQPSVAGAARESNPEPTP